MIRGRLALLMLATCTLLGGTSHGSQIERDSADPMHIAIDGHPGSSIVWPHMARPVGQAALSRFTPWKTRIKSVLGESNHEIIEERDFGPAIEPGQHFSLGTLQLVICPPTTFPPLRC
jgi:hypothetical protein